MRSRDKVIKYQIHAVRRMRRRGVNKDRVERAIRHGKNGKAERPNSIKFTLKISNKTTIYVIAEEKERAIWVVTAWKK